MTFPFFYYFNWVDYTIIGVVLFSTIISLFRGFLREAVSLMVWVFGVLLALKLANSAQGYFSRWFTSQTLRYWAAFFAIFFIVFLVGILINILIHSLVQKSGLTLTDSFLGFFFGLARGFVIVAVLLMFASAGGVKEGTALARSHLAPKFEPEVAWLNEFLPQQVRKLSYWVLDNHDDNVVEGSR